MSSATAKDDAAPSRDPQPLGYAPRLPWHRKRRIRRVALLVALLLLGLAAWRWGGPWWRQARYLHCQARCLDYTAPPDMVVYEENAPDVDLLLAKGGGYRMLPRTDRTLREFYRQYRLAAYYPPELWAILPQQSAGIAFVHRRRSPRGPERLVVVAASAGESFQDYGYFLAMGHGRVYEPATWESGSTLRLVRDSGLFWHDLAHPPHALWCEGMRLFAGQADPSDESHFTIDYETYRLVAPGQLVPQRGTIDGWLRDDDSVQLQLRDGGPLTRKPTAAELKRIWGEDEDEEEFEEAEDEG